jgi:hypothetical protein
MSAALLPIVHLLEEAQEIDSENLIEECNQEIRPIWI